MFVKMKSTIFNCEVGRVYDLDDEYARSFVKMDKAEAISASEFISASRKADDDELRRSIKSEIGAEVRAVIESFAKTNGNPNPQPPGTNSGVDFNNIASGGDPAVDANKRMFERIAEDNRRGNRRGIGEILRMVALLSKPQLADHPNQLVMASRRMQLLSGNVTEQSFDERTNTFTVRTTRENPDGSLDVITRTGTDSLSGGTTYGFALKPEYLPNLFEISMEQQVFANVAQRIPVGQGNEVKWPAWDQYQAPTTFNGVIQPAVVAGVQLAYESEAAQRQPTDAKLNTIDFKIVDLTAFTALSRDFVVDNYLAFDAALTRMIGRAFGWMEDYMSLQGPGIGRPQGYFNSPAALVVTRHSSSTVTSVDLTAMIASVSPMVWSDLRWITNITTIPQLAILANNSGTPVFQPNALITQANQYTIMDKSTGGLGPDLMHRPMGTLLGFPIFFSEKVPVLGTQGDISLVSPSQYGIAERSGLEIAVSEHYYFANDLIAYRLKKRHDMKALWRAPYQQADGSATNVSPFVLLS
jgi:HK97 family phage major capsid protein